MGKKNTQLFLILIVVIFLLSLRIIHPAADPPENLSMSGGPYGDPGGYAFHARNKILFGQWEIDRMNSPLYTSPIPALLTYLSFKFFGVGFIQMNLIPLFFSCLAMIIVFFLLRRTTNNSSTQALIAIFLLGANYLFLMYSRIANRVMPMIFFLVLALFFFLKGTKDKRFYLLAGICSFLAFMTKGVCLYIIVSFFLGFFVYLALKFGLKKALVPFSYYLLGFIACLFLWIIFVFIPHGDVLKSISDINKSFLVPPKNILKMLSHFWTRPPLLLERAPILFLLSGLSFILLIFKAAHEPKKLRLLEWIMFFWYSGGFVYFSIIYQRVPRHFIPQIIPMVLLASWLICDFLRSDRLAKPKRPNLFFGIAFFFWLLFPVSKILKPILDKLPTALSDIWVATSILALISCLLTFFIISLIRQWPENFSISFSPLMKKSSVVIILLGVLFFNGRQYLPWALHPEHKLKNISDDLGDVIDQAAISGLWAPVVCLENRHRAYESYPGFVNDEKDFLEKFQITHVFASTFFNGLEINYYRQNFPEAMLKAQLRARYFIWKGDVLLYELKPSTDPPGQKNFFEAEIYTRRQGMPRYDPESSGGFSVLSDKKKPGFVSVVSTPEKIPTGRYRVIFKMKRMAKPLKTLSRIARIDVVSLDTKRLLEAKNLNKEDFPKIGEYKEFSLLIDLKRPLKLGFRVYSDGKSIFWVDWIRIEKNSGV